MDPLYEHLSKAIESANGRRDYAMAELLLGIKDRIFGAWGMPGD